ncbi:MAG: hypothetical protein ABI651_07150 [Verrucomicrobiota bacterium]
MRCPAAPYHEELVRAEAERICAGHGLLHEHDEFGNLLVRLQTAPEQRPLVLAAHLDHPAFEIVRPLGPDRWAARFLGGVPDYYFCPGLALRLMPGAAPAKLGKVLGEEKQFEIHAPAALAVAPFFAVWEMDDFAVDGPRIIGRACDDLIGVAAILATLIDLKQTGEEVNLIGVISRAEEVGFNGALTVASSTRLPKDSLVISLETSREMPPVRMGEGPIIRVGDRTSIFDSAATRFLEEVAANLSAQDKQFQFQRALMSGGTCEATAYQEFGFQTAAVCVALGNYHNCGERGRIAAEFVHGSDACGMIRLLVESTRQIQEYQALTEKLPARMRKMLETAREALAAHPL